MITRTKISNPVRNETASNGVAKIWELKPKMPITFKKKFSDINPIILQLLYNRGLRIKKDIEKFLAPDYSRDIYDPFIFKDMKKAVKRIYQAIKNKEKILIYGDYDTDGVTSTTVLYNTFKKLGANNLSKYLPDREKEGYGMNKQAIESFDKQKINLIVTCDCGISNIEEIDLANKFGIDVIVTDHHFESDKLPDAYAIINPKVVSEKYPFRGLAGVGVAFKLCQALFRYLPKNKRESIKTEAFEKWLLDLVAIGTIGDIMPLLDENRVLVKYGLIVLNKTKNLGLRYLIEKTSFKLGDIDSFKVGYQISSRLNAAGRMDHANAALKLLLANNGEEARELAERLNVLNSNRQKEIDSAIKKLKKEIGEKPKDKILLEISQDWKIGIIGIIASRLVDYYHRPAIVFSQKDKKTKASGRSPSSFNLFDALNELKKYFLNFGGHARAAGFTLKNIDDFENFKKDILKIAKKKLKSKDLKAKIPIDVELNLDDVNWELEENLEKFRPFGKDNPQPNFLVKNVTLKNIRSVGKNHNHRQIIINGYKKLIYFNVDSSIDNLKIGDKIDVIFQLSINEWNGQRELQAKVIDLKKHI